MFFPHTHTHTHTHTHKHTHTHTHINHPVQVAAVREMIRNTQSTLLVLDSEGKALKRSVLSSFACCCKSPSLSSAPAFCYQSLFNAAHSPPPPPVRVQTHTHTHTHTKTHTPTILFTNLVNSCLNLSRVSHCGRTLDVSSFCASTTAQGRMV